MIATSCWDLRYAGEKCFQPITVSGWQEMFLKRYRNCTLDTMKTFFLVFWTSWKCTGVTKKSVLGQHANITHCWTTHTATPKKVSELISKVSGDGGSVAKDWNEELITETQQKAQCYFMDPFYWRPQGSKLLSRISIYISIKKEKKNHCNQYVVVYTFPERLE